jgi:hypothetical protein
MPGLSLAEAIILRQLGISSQLSRSMQTIRKLSLPAMFRKTNYRRFSKVRPLP